MEAFTVVMPVHNEEKYLPLSLPSVYNIRPSEIILIFDNCTDHSIEVAKRIMQKYDPTQLITKCVNDLPKTTEYTFRVAYVKRLGMSLASYNTALIVDADTILNPRIRDCLSQIERFPFISFGRIDYPINWRNQIKHVLGFIPLWKNERLTGLYAVDINKRNECEDSELIKSISLGEDTFLQQSIRKKYSTKHYDINSFHLRPREDSKLHYRRGLYYWKTARRGFFKTILSAIISGRLNLIKGYIHARFKG
ncbi:glycosyltransferase family 2 protein [Thermoproteota archaeon]